MVANNPLVSIIIPNYNREHKVVRAVRSCLSQSYTNLEVVVVDDGSTDGSQEVLRKLAGEDSRIRPILNSVNRGGNHCRNVGLQECRGAYVAFLDSDDEYHPAKIETQLQKFGPDDRVRVVVGSTVVKRERDDQTVRYTNRRIRPLSLEPRMLLDHYASKRFAWLTHEPLWERAFLQQVGGFSERLKNSQEYEFHTRALSFFPPVAIVEDCLATVYLHDGAERINGPSRKEGGKIERHFNSKVLSRFLVAQNLLTKGLFTKSVANYLLRFSAGILLRCYRISPALGFRVAKYMTICAWQTFGKAGQSLRAGRQLLQSPQVPGNGTPFAQPSKRKS